MRKPRPAAPATVAHLYVRVSTLRQAQDGVGLDAQEARGRAHAERLGLPVTAVFRDEGASGKDGVEDRPGLAAMLAEQERIREAGGEVVTVVYSVSRLARRQRLLWNLLDDRDGYGVVVSSATEPFDTSTPMGRAMLGMLATFAALEADMVSERTRDALAELKAQGRKLGAPSMERLGAGAAIETSRELYGTGAYSHASLAEELNRRGIPSAKGGRWWAKTVRTALQGAKGPGALPVEQEGVTT